MPIGGTIRVVTEVVRRLRPESRSIFLFFILLQSLVESMFGVIVYGSLLSRRELLTLALRSPRVQPVRLRGFRRSFDQEPSWRRRDSLARGVLTVAPHPRGTMNALLLTGLADDEFTPLDHRERGYDRREIDASQLAPFEASEPLLGCEAVFIYRGKPELRNPRLRPHPSYLKICLAGAGEWNSDFLREFTETTYVGSRRLSEVY